MKFSRLQRYLLSILSGLLMVISFPHTGSLFPLIFIAWVPLLLVEHNVYREKYKSSKVFIHAYLTFFIYNVGASYWIFYSIGGEAGAVLRSEEHTSELQSRPHLVCRLLLEKKK